MAIAAETVIPIGAHGSGLAVAIITPCQIHKTPR